MPDLRHAHGAEWQLLQVCQLREHQRLLLNHIPGGGSEFYPWLVSCKEPSPRVLSPCVQYLRTCLMFCSHSFRTEMLVRSWSCSYDIRPNWTGIVFASEKETRQDGIAVTV